LNVDEVALRLFGAWLAGRGHAGINEWEGSEGGLYRSGSYAGFGVVVAPLFDGPHGEWASEKSSLEEQLAAALENGAYVLWLPPGAALPLEEPDRTDFVFRLKMTGARLQSGERTDLKIPVSIGVHKQDEEGSYASVIGGLSPVWSWFTERIRGVYNVDARALTRLPESREEREALVEKISGELASMEVGENKHVPVEDSWTLQRIYGRNGFAIVGCHPDVLPAEREVRKRVRGILASAKENLSEQGTTALLMPALYLYASEENVSTAIRGFDPALYGGLDYIALIADGVVKPVIAPPS
jgi:hypothetical protein